MDGGVECGCFGKSDYDRPPDIILACFLVVMTCLFPPVSRPFALAWLLNCSSGWQVGDSFRRRRAAAGEEDVRSVFQTVVGLDLEANVMRAWCTRGSVVMMYEKDSGTAGELGGYYLQNTPMSECLSYKNYKAS